MTPEVCWVEIPTPARGAGDRLYEAAIRPVVQDCGLVAVRSDSAPAAAASLLLADFVIADLTGADPGLLCTLGIRVALHPITTITIVEANSAAQFAGGPFHPLEYRLEDETLRPEAAAEFAGAVRERLRRRASLASNPLSDLIPDFPKLDVPHEIAEKFQAWVQHPEPWRSRLNHARSLPAAAARTQAVREIENSLTDFEAARVELLLDLMLSYRDVSAWNDMVRITGRFPEALQGNLMVRQQRALALNRAGRRAEAQEILESIVRTNGPDPETLSLLGRVHKDRYRDLKKSGSPDAGTALEAAIEAYRRGFESDPRDAFPGINTITLLIEKGTAGALEDVRRLAPAVSFAVTRRGGAESNDYWDLATVLELSTIGRQWAMAAHVLPKMLEKAQGRWVIETTRTTFAMLKEAWQRAGEETREVDLILQEMDLRLKSLEV